MNTFIRQKAVKNRQYVQMFVAVVGTVAVVGLAIVMGR